MEKKTVFKEPDSEKHNPHEQQVLVTLRPAGVRTVCALK